jgi:hypothetical protein
VCSREHRPEERNEEGMGGNAIRRESIMIQAFYTYYYHIITIRLTGISGLGTLAVTSC